MRTEQVQKIKVVVREYDADKDLAGAEAVERSCEVSQIEMRTKQVQKIKVVVREYDADKDLAGAEAVERSCEVSQSGTVSIFTDLLGDPACRVHHSPAFLMLVAETVGPKKEIVGLIRGCVKTITCGKRSPRPAAAAAAVPIYTKAASLPTTKCCKYRSNTE